MADDVVPDRLAESNAENEHLRSALRQATGEVERLRRNMQRLYALAALLRGLLPTLPQSISPRRVHCSVGTRKPSCCGCAHRAGADMSAQKTAGIACYQGVYLQEWECPRERELRGRDQNPWEALMSEEYIA